MVIMVMICGLNLSHILVPCGVHGYALQCGPQSHTSTLWCSWPCSAVWTSVTHQYLVVFMAKLCGVNLSHIFVQKQFTLKRKMNVYHHKMRTFYEIFVYQAIQYCCVKKFILLKNCLFFQNTFTKRLFVTTCNICSPQDLFFQLTAQSQLNILAKKRIQS